MQLTAIIMIGPPGSGKSTWGEEFAKKNGYTYLSSDRNRARLGCGEEDQTVSAKAFSLLEREMIESLTRGQNVVVDACFVSKKSRKNVVKIARNYKAHLRAVAFELPREVILERNKKRSEAGGRNVATVAIYTMLKNYQKPTNDEFDTITIITNKYDNNN